MSLNKSARSCPASLSSPLKPSDQPCQLLLNLVSRGDSLHLRRSETAMGGKITLKKTYSGLRSGRVPPHPLPSKCVIITPGHAPGNEGKAKQGNSLSIFRRISARYTSPLQIDPQVKLHPCNHHLLLCFIAHCGYPNNSPPCTRPSLFSHAGISENDLHGLREGLQVDFRARLHFHFKIAVLSCSSSRAATLITLLAL